MGPADLALHLVNFVAPALAVASLVAIFGPFLTGKRPLAPGFIKHLAINSIVGAVVLAAGLWFFGRDGKMASYGALVVAVATSQWLLGRSWR